MLGVYFKVWRDLLKAQNPQRTLYYIDLYCGDGETFDKKARQTFETPVIVSLIKKGILAMKLDIRLLLNDTNTESITKLKKKIEDLGVMDKVLALESQDANKFIDLALSKVPKDDFVVVFIDPYNYKDLKWETIVKISQHNGKNYGRKAEMIINLPLYSLGEGMKSKHFEQMDVFFGTKEWHSKVNEYKELDKERPVFNALLDVYVKRLEGLGYRVLFEEISTLENNAPVYYIIFAVGNDEAYTIAQRAITFVRTQKKAWTQEKIAKITKIGGVGGGSGLEKWI